VVGTYNNREEGVMGTVVVKTCSNREEEEEVGTYNNR